MAGLSAQGQVLWLVVAVLVVVAALVAAGLRSRAGRLRRARAVLDAEAHVVETPPAGTEKTEPETTSSSESAPSDHGEQPTGTDGGERASAGAEDARPPSGSEEQTDAGAAGEPPDAEDTTAAANGSRPGAGQAGEPRDAGQAGEQRDAGQAGAAAGPGAGGRAGGERRVTRPPAVGVDSALAGLDAGRFTSSLSPTAGRRRPLMPVPRAAAEETAAEDADVDTKSEPPYPGAAHARPDGSSPSPEYLIKANVAVKRYYTDDSPYFARTTAQVWFRSVEDAERAGFTAAS